jgi:hypothetical protein
MELRHYTERKEIEEAHLQEFNEFNERWDQKMNEFMNHALELEKELQQKHEQDIINLRA